MITLLTGENTFEATRALNGLVGAFHGDVERVDGAELETQQLPDIFMGATLFATERMVIVKNLSDNKSVWNDLVDWLPRISDDIHVIFVEAKPDKRTKTYKELHKIADVQEFKPWTERDNMSAEKWAISEAQVLGFSLDKKSAQTLVARIGVEQWQLHSALQKLAVIETVTPEVIADTIEATPAENVFNLFEAALRGDMARVSDMIRTLEQTDDPFMVFGLLSGQAFQLAALATADRPAADIAKAIGAHPFALQKLNTYAQRRGRNGAKKILMAFAEADEAMKSTAADPWLLVERALAKTANA